MASDCFTPPFIPKSLPQKLQDLPPKGAHLALEVRDFLANSPSYRGLGISLENRKLAVAFSGGADSLALLVILRCLSASVDFEVLAFHLDHCLRPSSAKEALWCEKVCKALGVFWESQRLDVAAMHKRSGGSLEECARNARYALLRDFAKKHQCHWICTGHQLNDLAEDILMRLLRGAGWPALGGMRAVDNDRQLLRPILLQQRENIECFLKALGMGWIEDESNSSMEFLRNRVRHKILPLFLKENPNFIEQMGHLWQLGRADEEYFKAQMNQHSQLCCPKVGNIPGTSQISCSRSGLLKLDLALRLRIFKEKLDNLGVGQSSLQGLLSLDQALQGRQFPKIFKFNGHKRVIVSGQEIIWEKNSS